MATYKIEIMDATNFRKYMTGEKDYQVQTIDVEASTTKEAITIAEANYPDMIINKDFVKTAEELEAEEARKETEWEKFLKAEVERKAKAKAKREAKEKQKAKALGLTVEKYKAKVRHDKKVREAEAKVASLEKALEEAKNELAQLKK